MDRRRDPMELWVGSWQPEDAVDRNLRDLRRRTAPDELPREQAPPPERT